MKPCAIVKQFDVAYHGILFSLGQGNIVNLRDAYEEWVESKDELARHLESAARQGKLDVVGALDKLVAEAFNSLNADGKTLIDTYPAYLSARRSQEIGVQRLYFELASAFELKLDLPLCNSQSTLDMMVCKKDQDLAIATSHCTL